MTDSIDSLLKQLNVLIQSTTDLSNHANITKAEIENLANSAKEKSVSITNDKDIITESKNQAIAAKEEILSIENQIEDKIYTDKATIVPTENKSPIAKSDGYLDQSWIEPINIPSEAVSLPLKENLYLDKGKGQLDTIDLSQAQDGSLLIEIPNTDKAMVKGDYSFSENQLSMEGELIPSTEPANRSISAELGKVEYTPANPKGYTPLFDGTGTIITLDPWKPSSEFEISFNFTIEEDHNAWQHFFCSDSGSNPVRVGINSSNLIVWATPTQKVFLDGEEIQSTRVKAPLGTHEIVTTIDLYPTTDVGDDGIIKIGSRNDGRECFKGNITNVKFKSVDVERHYSLVEYSDTEPTTRVAIDELSRNGTVVSTPDTGNWTNYPRLNNGLLTFIEGAYFAVKIKGKFKTKPDGEFIYYHGTENTKVTLTELEFESDWLFGNPTNDKGRYGLYNNSGTNVELEHIEVLTGKHGKMIGFPETNAFIETDERPTLIADGDSVAQWAVNYDGANVCVDTDIWEPKGKTLLSCDVIIKSVNSTNYDINILGGGARYRIRHDRFQIISGDEAPQYDQIVRDNSDLWGNVFNIKWLVDYHNKSFSVFINNSLVGKSDVLRGTRYYYNILGKNTLLGQISNLKLIDYNDPENCRFYKGTIYSYVDPESTNVQMPKVTILKDEWCKEKDALTIQASDGWVVNNNSVSLNAAGTKAINISTNDISNEGIYRFTSDPITADNVRVYFTEADGTDNSIFIGTTTGLVAKKVDVYFKTEFHVDRGCRIWLRIDDHPSNRSSEINNITLTKTTHGIIRNPNSVQPWVPLLGNREEFCGDWNVNNFIRGVLFTEGFVDITWHGGGSSFENKIPNGSIIISTNIVLNNSIFQESGGSYRFSKINGTNDQIQKAFQYPNVFKVIKPTDPDYEFYNNLYTKKEE